MASAYPGLFVRPTLSIGTNLGVVISTDNDGDGIPSNRIYPTVTYFFIIILDALFDKYTIGR